MKTQTIRKMEVLVDNNVISKDIHDKINKVDEYLKSLFPKFDEYDTDFMFTHLSMAMDRVSKDKQLTEANDFVKVELEKSEFIVEAKTLLSNISDLTELEFNEPEALMILLHLCTLAARKGQWLRWIKMVIH